MTLKNTDHRSIIIIQFTAYLIFSYIVGGINQVRNIYFAVVLIPVLVPVIFTTVYFYASGYITKIAFSVLCVITTIALVYFDLWVAPIWFRVMV
ncbi:hypothetical protein AYW79_11605 [Ferroacidibacillus organovorans]|uniref:Uncharacterized protein n=1 Tax=Ferroacidibacillus organovorans TaxID=1765683 RepID=A0A162T0K6_9BACL|nr:hypothetical protein AYJ22_11685 [Ferroacidibacillus organovorans]OAG93267.1 hypothetical protein AYW79_11605 [Ferroacidibacillus organovorans]OPG15282.1 hypothetical protein B2M26_12515 [Ferroacidibacillus organovorans]